MYARVGRPALSCIPTLTRRTSVSAAALLTAACAMIPIGTPEEVVGRLNGTSTNIRREAVTSAYSQVQQSISGLSKPIEMKCALSKGRYSVQRGGIDATFDGSTRYGFSAPGRVFCFDSADGTWGADLSYSQQNGLRPPSRENHYQMIGIAMNTKFLSASVIARLEAENADSDERERRRLAAEREAKAVASAAASAAAAARERERRARIPAFQQSLKVGDRILMQESLGTYFGLVIAVNRPIAQVQFFNVTFSGSPVAWVEISRLEPPE